MFNGLSGSGKNFLHKFIYLNQKIININQKVDSENIPVLFNIVENHFKTVDSLKKAMSNSESRLYRYRPSLCPLVIRDKLINELSDDPTVIDPNLKAEITKQPSNESLRKLNFHKAANFILRVLSHKNHVSKKHRQIITASEKFQSKIAHLEEKSLKMAPEVENRIIIIKDKKVIYHIFSRIKTDYWLIYY